MKTLKQITIVLVLFWVGASTSLAQTGKSVYGDAVKAAVKMNYVYDYAEALKQAKAEGKLVFFNCFADWAVPCHGMNKYVFSDQKFCDFMNARFVNLWMDMVTGKGNELAQKYHVKTFAHYLILDADGNVVQRIVGGSKLPEFRQQVEMALSDSTSLQGTSRLYAAGDHSKSTLSRYLKALRVAGEDSMFTVVGKEYLKYLQPAELAGKDGWMLIRLAIPNRDSKLYPYLISHKQLFVDSLGAKVVDTYIESLVCSDIMRYATGGLSYDKSMLESYARTLDEAQLPDTCVSRVLLCIANLRGEKNYPALLDYMESHGRYLTFYRANVEMSFDFSDLSEVDKVRLVAYLEKAAVREGVDTSAGKSLSMFARQLASGAGIQFIRGSFREILAHAKKERKLVFMDCYTTWCGPCRMMSSLVFTRKDVGDTFNPFYVSYKCDMEKGEGIELAKRYNVKVYPTMLILDANGEVVYSFTGARSPQDLIKIGKEYAKIAEF